jgi:hypothetical protein
VVDSLSFFFVDYPALRLNAEEVILFADRDSEQTLRRENDASNLEDSDTSKPFTVQKAQNL